MSKLTKKELFSFEYKALFQSVRLQFFQSNLADEQFRVTCEATIKLPILKKDFVTETVFNKTIFTWIEHQPVQEKEAPPKKIQNSDTTETIMDPVGFFLSLHEGLWQQPQVCLQVGAKQVVLRVEKDDDAYTIHHDEKNKKLILKYDKTGITSVEIPLPVLGNVALRRVE